MEWQRSSAYADRRAGPDAAKRRARHRRQYPTRFVIGSDAWVNQRWQYYGELMQGYRVWLGDLPPEVARNIGWDNGARLFRLN